MQMKHEVMIEMWFLVQQGGWKMNTLLLYSANTVGFIFTFDDLTISIKFYVLCLVFQHTDMCVNLFPSTAKLETWRFITS